MGEAKRKGALRDRLLHDGAVCIYCGGATPAETIDHMPPHTVFLGRQRPAGLEFPACHACNDGSRPDEQVASLISRVYPDPVDKTGGAEIQKLLDGVANNHPGLLAEMLPRLYERRYFRRPGRRVIETANVVNVGGPLVTAAMNRFGAKLGLALHHAQTARIVPAGGAIMVRWFSNIEALEGKLPESLLRAVGALRTLRQGKRHVGDQFRFGSCASEDGTISGHFATFRFSFAVVALIDEASVRLEPAPHSNLFRSGFLRQARS